MQQTEHSITGPQTTKIYWKKPKPHSTFCKIRQTIKMVRHSSKMKLQHNRMQQNRWKFAKLQFQCTQHKRMYLRQKVYYNCASEESINKAREVQSVNILLFKAAGRLTKVSRTTISMNNITTPATMTKIVTHKKRRRILQPCHVRILSNALCIMSAKLQKSDVL